MVVSKQARRKPKSGNKLTFRYELQFIRLVECNARLQISGKAFPNKVALKLQCGFAEPVREDGAVLLTTRIIVELNVTSDENSESRMEITCGHEVRFKADREPSADEMQIVIGSAAHIAWPFAREVVNSITSKMGGPQRYYLPLVHVDPGSSELIKFATPSERTETVK